MSAARSVGRKDYTYGSTVGKEIPLSFGANFNDDPICRTNLKKSHTLGAADLQHHDEREDLNKFASPTSYDITKSSMVTSSQTYGAGASGKHLSPKDSVSASFSASTSSAPPKAVDETVLRFLGYYTEAIPESSDEQFRVHKVALLYHCADNTIVLREAVQVNAGMAQGVILKRQAVPKPGGGIVTLDDLDIGAVVDVFGKKVTLIECSSATREYLVEQGGRARVADNLPWPSADDKYNTRVAQKLQTKPRRQLPTTDFDHKRALEAMRGSGIISKHAPDDVRTAQQFLRNRINEHLNFAAYYDERERISGDLRFVVIKYFLENDTIEIVEQRPENAGREGAAKLHCRQRVPHPDAPEPTSATVQQNTYGLLLKQNYVNFDDLTVGIRMTIAGNDYFIYDADDFTRKWYQENRGRSLPSAVDVSDVVKRGTKPLPVQYPPPHNGFGSEEDSIRSCKSLLVKPPRIDTEKLRRENGKVMIFKASLHGSTDAEDVGREFIIAFHRATDEVEITERQLRNSGIVGGKFLAKGRHLKTLPDGRRVPYEPSDFAVGTTVRIGGRTFVLEQIDERSRRKAAGEIDPVSEARIKDLIVTFRELLNAKFYRAHEAYRALAPDGSLTSLQLIEFFEKASGDITEEEANHLMDYFTGGAGTGKISFEQFRKIMDPGNTFNLDEAANNPRSIKNVRVYERGSAEATTQAEDLKRSCDVAADEAATRRLHKAFAAKLVQRRGTFQEAFRMLAGHAPNARLSQDALLNSLDSVLRLSVTTRERDLLLRAMFDTEDKRQRGLDFKAFYEFVDAV